MPWSRDVRSVLLAAVQEASPAPVRLVVLTAPGVAVLPWDEGKCTVAGAHVHSGRLGCRVEAGARDRWEAALAGNWKKMREAVSQRLARLGYSSPFLGWVDEDQERGVKHRNVLLVDGPAARAYHAALVALGPRYGFGFVDRKRRAFDGRRATNYVCGYLVASASGKKARRTDLTAAARRSSRYCRVWVVSPRLTKITGCTRRSLRLGRQVWAARQGLCPWPTEGLAVCDWTVIDCLTGEVRNRIYPAEGEPPAL